MADQIMVSGPCFICNKDTSYKKNAIHVQFGDQWLEARFEATNRRRMMSKLRSLGGRYDGKPAVHSMLDFACAACVAELEANDWKEVRDQRKAERDEQMAELAKQAALQAALKWRSPRPGEFEIVDGSKPFRATRGSIEYNIVFRWRTSLRERCRGANTAFHVGMWVNGSLSAHYVGWTLEDGHNDEDPDERDVFAKGLRRWFECFFQDDLLQSDPTFSLDVRVPQKAERIYGSTSLVHCTWLDGSRVALVSKFATVEDAAQFARKHLGMEIVHLDWCPVAPTEEEEEPEQIYDME